MRRFLVRFSESEASNHTPSLADFTITTPELKFSVHTTVALLEDLGHHVVEAHSGKEALAILREGLNPDLVITDHAMPGMTGTDLAVRLRVHDPRLPILLATGYAELQGELPIEIPRLAKPYTQEQLSLEIARLLPERRFKRG